MPLLAAAIADAGPTMTAVDDDAAAAAAAAAAALAAAALPKLWLRGSGFGFTSEISLARDADIRVVIGCCAAGGGGASYAVEDRAAVGSWTREGSTAIRPGLPWNISRQVS